MWSCKTVGVAVLWGKSWLARIPQSTALSGVRHTLSNSRWISDLAEAVENADGGRRLTAEYMVQEEVDPAALHLAALTDSYGAERSDDCDGQRN